MSSAAKYGHFDFLVEMIVFCCFGNETLPQLASPYFFYRYGMYSIFRRYQPGTFIFICFHRILQ